METVAAFNSELSGLYDSKPPISKAKMASITRAAMKAIKFYKHVVQSVEKFILKCKPEYKIPGLYVIDSIVRQSRHQFGTEKDVFAPRFARNIKQTFANLFRCSPEDKSRIIRVLNLWQKNHVFAPDVIQPLFDLADPNNPIYQTLPSMNTSMQDISTASNGLNTSMDAGAHDMDDSHSKSVDLATASGHQTANTLDQNTIRQLQQLQQILMRQTNESAASGGSGGVGCSGANQPDSIKFNKRLLDYDYGDEEEEDRTTPHVPNLLDGNNLSQLLKDPNVLRQLQTLQKLKQQEEKQAKLNEMRLQEEAFEKHLQNVLKASAGEGRMPVEDMPGKEAEYMTADGNKIEVINLDGNDSRTPTPDRDRYNKRRRSSRSRSPRDARGRDRRRRSSRSRSPRSRSRGGSRSPRSNRRRNSRERIKDKEREKDKDKEYERERRRKGLPDIKKDHLSVCSTTLWVGHLSKLVQQEELSDTFGKYGDIVSIDMIHPRGCAFIVMNRRQDAHKAMSSLKNYKMQGRAITISWAAGKGVKSKEWKDYWDLDLGVTYIPWARLAHDTDLTALEEGGMFDEDSMPEWMKDKLNQKKNPKDKPMASGLYGVEGLSHVDTSQPPPNAGAMMTSVPMVPPFPLGPVPRMLPPPMGVPLPGNIVSGIVPGMPMPPSVVPGIPPPHMLPPGGMVPGFGPIPPPMDKSVPPPSTGPPDGGHLPFMSNMPIPPPMQPPFPSMGMPPHFVQQQQQQQTNLVASSGMGNQNDDQMDIEMEDEQPMNIQKLPPPMNFTLPPPMFPPPSFGMPEMLGMGNDRKNEHDDRSGRDNLRDRNDFSNQRERGSRWGNERSQSRDRDMAPQERNDMNDGRPDFTRRGPPDESWHENGPGPNFPPPNFGERRGPGGPPTGPPNMIGLDMQTPPPNLRPPPEFFDGRRDDFSMDDRRGGSLPPQRDFFQNQGNRFAPPQMGMGRGGQIPIRGGPPQPPFGPRLGPMFVRGPIRPGGPPGFTFGNDHRNPFERNDRGGGGDRGGGNMGNRMRGGNNNGMDRKQNNWREDGDENRRASRFHNRDNDRSEGKGRDRFNRGDRDNRGNNRNERKNDWNDRNERITTPPPPAVFSSLNDSNAADAEEDWDDDGPAMPKEQHPQSPQESNKYCEPKPCKLDTEEDWDDELVEHKVDDGFKPADPPDNEQADHSELGLWDNNESCGFSGFKDSEIFLNTDVNSEWQNNKSNNSNNMMGHCNENDDSAKGRVTPDPPEISLADMSNSERESAEQTTVTPLYDETGGAAC